MLYLSIQFYYFRLKFYKIILFIQRLIFFWYETHIREHYFFIFELFLTYLSLVIYITYMELVYCILNKLIVRVIVSFLKLSIFIIKHVCLIENFITLLIFQLYIVPCCAFCLVLYANYEYFLINLYV